VKTILAILIVNLSITFKITAQDFYSETINPNVVFKSMIRTSDSCFLLAGNIDSTINQGVVMKVSGSGNTIWSKVFADPASLSFEKVTENPGHTGYLIAGSSKTGSNPASGLLLFIDVNGNIQWQKKYTISLSPGYPRYFYDVTYVTPTKIIVTGNYYDTFGIPWGDILHVDSSGNAIQVLGLGKQSSCSGFTLTDDSNVVFAFTKWIDSTYDHKVTIVKTDTTFNQIYYQKQFIINSPNNYVPEIYKGKMDSNGEYSFVLRSSDFTGLISDLYRLNFTSGITLKYSDVSAGFSTSSYDKLFFQNYSDQSLWELDSSDQNIVRNMRTDNFTANQLIFYQGNTYAIGMNKFICMNNLTGCYTTPTSLSSAGQSLPTLTNAMEFFGLTSATNLTVTNTFITENSSSGIQSTCIMTTVSDDRINLLEAFPNPSNGIISIPSPIHSVDNKILVSDICGKSVSFSIIFVSLNQIQIDLSNHPDGIYFIQIGSESFKVLIAR